MNTLFGEEMHREAHISECGRYRYSLTRVWDEDIARCCTFIMLNPSTADDEQDDPTIRRCINFAKRLGCGSLDVLNLFAWRATNPSELLVADDPIGPECDWCLSQPCGHVVIAAWGAHGNLRGRDQQVLELLKHETLWCLGTTFHGQPRHPLYVRADQPLVRYGVDVPQHLTPSA